LLAILKPSPPSGGFKPRASCSRICSDECSALRSISESRIKASSQPVTRWILTYRAHHKADTMTTTGHIVNAMREIDVEEGKNDWVRAVVDVPGVGG
jgi:hypothetical protein